MGRVTVLTIWKVGHRSVSLQELRGRERIQIQGRDRWMYLFILEVYWSIVICSFSVCTRVTCGEEEDSLEHFYDPMERHCLSVVVVRFFVTSSLHLFDTVICRLRYSTVSGCPTFHVLVPRRPLLGYNSYQEGSLPFL